MKIIVPFVTSDVSLVSSTIPYTDPYATLLTFNITSSSVANPTVITTSAPHGYTVGQNIIVNITGHTGTTPAISGEYVASVTGASTFTIPVNVTVGGGATGTVSSPSYNAATTYAAGAIVQVDSPSFTFTASGYLFTAVAHGHVQGDILQVSSSGTLPAGLSAGVMYYVVNTTLDTFMLATSKDTAATPIATTTAGTGTHTATASTHLLYQSVAAGNVNNTPLSSAAYWLVIGNTNRYKCIDAVTASQTFANDTMTYVIQTTGMIDSVYFGNIDAASATITARDPSAGLAIVYGPTTYPLRDYVATFFDWFFSPIENVSDFSDIDLPAYPGMQITITLTKTGDTVKAGTILVGRSKDLGVTLAGVSFAIRDYSLKTANDFGYYVFQERAFSKLGTFQLIVPNADVDSVNKVLAKYRATPIVYVGTTLYTSAMFYGKFNSFSTAVAYTDYSTCNMEVEGLT